MDKIQDRDMREVSLLEFYKSSDALLASFVRESILGYLDMDTNNQLGIAALERFKDALFMITITGDLDD